MLLPRRKFLEDILRISQFTAKITVRSVDSVETVKSTITNHNRTYIQNLVVGGRTPGVMNMAPMYS